MKDINKVFLIDDDRLSNFVNRSVFKSLGIGIETHSFDCGDMALNNIKELYANGELLPRFIFLDVNMPGMDGWSFVEAYEKLLPADVAKQSIYMLSATVYAGDIERAKNYPAVVGFICKPLKTEKLESLLELVRVEKT